MKIIARNFPQAQKLNPYNKLLIYIKCIFQWGSKFFKIPIYKQKFFDRIVEKQLNEDLIKRNVPLYRAAQLKSSYKKVYIERLENQFNYFLKYFKKKWKDEIPDTIKTGHIRAFSKNVVPNERVNEYRKPRWKWFYSNENHILGACGVLHQIKSDKKYTTFWTKDYEMIKVYLPISNYLWHLILLVI